MIWSKERKGERHLNYRMVVARGIIAPIPMHEIDMPSINTPEQTLSDLNKVLAKALRALARQGVEDEACTLAAEAWSLLRHTAPKEAERMNALLHYVTLGGSKRDRENAR